MGITDREGEGSKKWKLSHWSVQMRTTAKVLIKIQVLYTGNIQNGMENVHTNLRV